MPVWAPADACSGTGRCFMSRTATGEKRRVLAEVHIAFMLCSQIKLASYDFSDVHITGEFDNRPGTGRF